MCFKVYYTLILFLEWETCWETDYDKENGMSITEDF